MVKRSRFVQLVTTGLTWLCIANAVLIAQVAPSVSSDSQSTKPLNFQVVSVRLDKSEAGGSYSFPANGDGVDIKDLSLEGIIASAYNFLPDRILGIPNWAKQQRFDIQAKVDESDLAEYHKLTQLQRNMMLQAVLEDRFKIKQHREARDIPIYELVVDKSGSNLQQLLLPTNLLALMKEILSLRQRACSLRDWEA